jgi:hypothetical protein
MIMSRRLDFDKDLRKQQAKCGLSVQDELEWMENDAAARWLARNARRGTQKADPRLSADRPPCRGMNQPPRKKLKRRHAGLDPCDPYDQLPGVDMKQVPWE